MSKTYRSGIGFPSYAATATFATASGYSNVSGYPSTNLSNKRSPRTVASFVQPSINPATQSSWAFTAILPAAQQLQFFAFVHHNIPAKKTGSVLAQGSQFRIRLFSDNNPDPVGNTAHIVWDSGREDFWPALDGNLGFPGCRPYLLNNPVIARSAYVDVIVDTGTTGETYDLGFFDMAAWWSWGDMQDDRGLGFDTRSQIAKLAGNVDFATSIWTPRALSGSRLNLSLDNELDTTCIDFQQQHATWNPFVYVDDADDPSSWGRLCFLARNASLPAPKAGLQSGDFSFDIVEHNG